MSTYAIGDIHGCLDELKTLHHNLIREADLQPYDTLVFVGDYVDRGPDSKGVIDYLIGLSQSQKCVFLMGNHEDMMLWYLGIDHGNDTGPLQGQQLANVWLPNGGRTTMQSYGVDDLVDFHNSGGTRERLVEIVGEQHIDFLMGLQYSYIEGSHLFVHAGVSPLGAEAKTPREAVEESTDEILLWDRESFHRPNNFGTMVYGHTPNRTGVRWLHRKEGDPFNVGTDVGCVFGDNPLTAVRTSDWTEVR